ncbi:MAG: siderophore-interacting protein [Actinomycetota bacterium]
MPTTIQGFPDTFAADVESLLEHLQGSNADTILFIAAHAGDPVDDATAATISLVTPTSVEMELQTPQGAVSRVFEIDEITELAGMQASLIGLLGVARTASPDHPQTSIEAVLNSTADLKTYVTTVVATERITPALVQLTLAGGLDDLPAVGGDEFFYVLVPRRGAEDVIGDDFTMADRESGPEDRRPFGAYYTTRRRRDGEIDLWVVLHDHDEGVAAWAREAAPGDRVAIWGPRSVFQPVEDAAGHLLVCDETGMAAAASLIDQLADDHPVTLVVETADEDHLPPFPEREAVRVHPVFRGDAEPGTSGGLLAAVQGLAIETDRMAAFGAAESREISAVRRHLRRERGMEHAHVNMTGYWRRDNS